MRDTSRMLLLELQLPPLSEIYSASTSAGSNSLYGGDIPRASALHDANKRIDV